MSTVDEVIDTLEHLEQNRVIQRASVEPESLDETSTLLGHSKRSFPKRVKILLVLSVLFSLCVLTTALADIDIIYRSVCFRNGVDQKKCLSDKPTNEAVANFMSVAMALGALTSLTFSTQLSALSDLWGRKPVIIIAMVTSIVAKLMNWFLVFSYPHPISYWLLLIPVFIENIGSGLSLVGQLSVAYISDMVPNASHRTRLLAVADGVIFGTIAVGPMLGSYLIKQFGLETVYKYTINGMCIVAVISFFLLQESLSTYKKRKNSVNKRSVVSSFSLLKFEHIENKDDRWNVRILLVYTIAITLLAESIGVVSMLYPRRKFGWSAIETGQLVSASSFSRAFWLSIGFPFIYGKLSNAYTTHSSKLDNVDLSFIRVSLLFWVLGSICMAWSNTPIQFFISALLKSCSASGGSVLMSVLIKHLPEGQYGAFMAVYNFIRAAMSLIIPTFFMKIYAWASYWRPFLPYEIQTVIFAAMLLFTICLLPAM